MKLEPGGAQPSFIEKSEATLSELGTNPLFAISLDKLEAVFKTWVWQVLAEVKPVEEVPQYLTRVEASERLHISLPTLSRYIKSGIVNGNKVGNRVLIREDELSESLIAMKRRKIE